MEIIRAILSSMSCCSKHSEYEHVEPTERTSLLEHDRVMQIRRISENSEINVYASSLPKSTKDDHSALNKIVQETNDNIIDVAALDTTQTLDQTEYNDRVRLYNQRLASSKNPTSFMLTRYDGLLKDIPHPENVLQFSPQSDEIDSIKEFIKESAQAIDEMKIEIQEDLIVPFQVKEY